MNRLCYRVAFNRLRRLLMAGGGKGHPCQGR